MEARQPENRMKVFLSIRSKSQWNRSYPKLEIGSLVRTRVKAKAFKKGFHSAWSDQAYKLTFIKDGQYLLNNGKRVVYNRHDLLLIPAAHGKEG